MDVYQPKNPIRIVSAASLFDGHDAAINIMRRILQASGAEVIHLGHNRSVAEVVDCAIQEDAQAIAMTSYQGGHVEYLKYMFDLLKEAGSQSKIFAGGGGTILPTEIKELESYGIRKVYSPDDGRELGLQGMINHLLAAADFPTIQPDWQLDSKLLSQNDSQTLAQCISVAENHPEIHQRLQNQLKQGTKKKKSPILGITGTGGAGKSSLVDELIRRFLLDQPEKKAAVISIDPTKRKSGGALLGDRIRMNSIHNSRLFMRSLATRQSNLAISSHIQDAIEICQKASFDLIIIETSGIGQSDSAITEFCDASLYVMTSEYGAATQLEKIDMLDFADIIAINKFEKKGSLDALRDVRKQYKRNHQKFTVADEDLPIYGTIASQFNDSGTHDLYLAIIRKLAEVDSSQDWKHGFDFSKAQQESRTILPPERVRYLSEIQENSANLSKNQLEQIATAQNAYQVHGVMMRLCHSANSDWNPFGEGDILPETNPQFLKQSGDDPDWITLKSLTKQYQKCLDVLDADSKRLLRGWPTLQKNYAGDEYVFQVRNRDIKVQLTTESLAKTKVPKVSLPRYEAWGDIIAWLFRENIPGSYPYTAGVFPFKRQGEDPARMFAGEGGPERTNKRFHYLSQSQTAKRLSTAFDSVTLYGEDPALRPDIYGKVGNSGVSVATLDDAKKLYSGFDLCSSSTSVSMTINGPAPMVLAFFLNAATDQQCEKHIRETGQEEAVRKKIEKKYSDLSLPLPSYQGELPEGNDRLGLMLLGVSGSDILPLETYNKIQQDTLKQVRGTVQADILKEDQAQNTCIFSTEFALKMMGDIQQYFTENQVRNFYSVSISGYHIAEAGANPITQLAFTLANGFTFVEYYIARGLNIDDFANNLSFFFSNGLDPEYAVIGRAARRIWAKAMRHCYGANLKSQKLKYHIQTSGRSLHAQEIAFNDIRTTLQALYALYDNCNSLHTNAYDEAITTPTEESVRRALAIQLIINKELGLFSNENPLQGSFVIEDLTDLVEEAVYKEFNRLTDRGGVLGAMESMYQRTKIQEESMHYEHLKHTGDLEIVGVNTFLATDGSPTIIPSEVIRSTNEEKNLAIDQLETFHKAHKSAAVPALQQLQNSAIRDENVFTSLMEASRYCSLGQMTHLLYDVGGRYRRNM